MWDDSIIKYPGAPFQARRRYGARRIIRKNCAYRGKLRDNPQIARSGAIHRAAGRFARKPRRALSLDRPFFLRSAEKRFTEIRRKRASPEAPARLCRENTVKDGKSGAGDAVLFAMPRALPRFLPLTFLRSAEERFTEIREAQIRKRRRGSAVRTRSRTENRARGSAVLFAMPRALPRFFHDFFAKRRKAVHGNPGKRKSGSAGAALP